MTEAPQAARVPSSSARSRFSIDSILQRPTGLHCHWLTPEAILQLQQQQQRQQQQQQATTQPAPAAAAAASSAATVRQQYLVHFLLNSTRFSPPLVALNAPYPHHRAAPSTVSPSSSPSSSSPLLASAAVGGTIPAGRSLGFPLALGFQIPPSTRAQITQIAASYPRPRPSLKAVTTDPLKPSLAPPSPIRMESEEMEEDADPGSPRRRQVSVDSAGASNESEEETDLTAVRVRGSSMSVSPLLLSSVSNTAVTSRKNFTGSSSNSNSSSSSSSSQAPRCKESVFKKSRTSFTKNQLEKLEAKFCEQKYLTKLDRTRMAREVGLTEKHVKTWFQNRRTKWKKDCSDADWSKHKEFAAALMYGQYLEAKNGSGGELGEEVVGERGRSCEGEIESS